MDGDQTPSAVTDGVAPQAHIAYNVWTTYLAPFLAPAWPVLSSNYINVLLVFVPIGVLSHELGFQDTTTFVVGVLAIMPLGALVSFSAQSLIMHHEQSSRGLIRAASRNLVDVIVLMVALVQDEVRIVQAGILGAMLANMLLMLGSCFVAAGIRREESHFNQTVASMTSTLLAIAAAYLVIPTVLAGAISYRRADPDDWMGNILVFSRGTALLMLDLYGLYLFFRLKTHARLFNVVSTDIDQEITEPPHIGARVALALMAAVSFITVICATHLIKSINTVVYGADVSKTFMGLILLPLLGISEHIATWAVAYQDSMDLAVDVAIGGCTQIVLFVAPLLVVVGWILGIEMTLDFGAYDTLAFLCSVLIVNYLIQDGKSNYLEGCVLLVTWLIIAVVFYVYELDRGRDNLVMP